MIVRFSAQQRLLLALRNQGFADIAMLLYSLYIQPVGHFVLTAAMSQVIAGHFSISCLRALHFRYTLHT